MANILAIVGRPNVGKSTLFNRLTKTRRAIVSSEAGTTRDRQYGRSEWNGKDFSVIDTGGWVVNSEDIFEGEINRQVNLAIQEADVVLLVVDVNEGVTQFDAEVAHLLRQAKKPTILAVNKVDTFDEQYGAAEFYNTYNSPAFIIAPPQGRLQSAVGVCLAGVSRKLTEPDELEVSYLQKVKAEKDLEAKSK